MHVFAFALTMALYSASGLSRHIDETRPLPVSEPRPSAQTVAAWKARRFGMFIHFGLYSELGGVWNGRQIDNGYSEQIMANAPVPRDQYAALAKSFDPEQFNADAIVALAKAAGMKFIVVTAKHHDGFAMFDTRQSEYNIVKATPFHRDVVKELADACARGGLKFGVYYSTIDWHAPTGSPYIEGNSNPISDAHARFNAAQLKELLTGYGPLSEIWFDMGKPTPAQSKLFAQTVHRLQPQTMVSGRVFNYEGDFTVMGDNEVPAFAIDEPWQTPASIFGETWGYRSWQKRGDSDAKIHEKIIELATVAGRGGNYILNIGPEGNGSVVPFEADVLRGIGAWLGTNGEAVFGTADAPPQASPFRTLDFGYATLSHDKLYLFTRNIPADGKLHLPGVEAGVRFGKPYLLGSHADVGTGVTENKAGAAIDVSTLQQNSAGAFLPVVAVPYTGKLSVRPATTVEPDANGTVTLKESSADKFLNYNGRGYEAPATIYKLRWWMDLPAGRYKVEVHYNRPSHADVIDLVTSATRYRLPLQPGEGEGVWSGQIALPRASQNLVSIALTPREPFLKGTPLPAKILSMRLVPLQ
jgi:alpha-L-fucosidase